MSLFLCQYDQRSLTDTVMYVSVCLSQYDRCHTQTLPGLWNFKQFKYNVFLKSGTNFSLRKRKLNETKLAEEYCWAITHVAGRGEARRSHSGRSVSGVLRRSHCGRSVSGVFKSGFQLVCSVSYPHTYIVSHIYIQFRLEKKSTCPRPSGTWTLLKSGSVCNHKRSG